MKKISLPVRKVSFLSCLLALFSLPAFSQADCGCNVTLNPDPATGQIYANGQALGIKPGDKVCIKAGNYTHIYLYNFYGSASQPVTITNCGGLVNIANDPSYGFLVKTSKYLKITGSGASGVSYGFKVDGTPASQAVGVAASEQVSDLEFDHFEVLKSGAGIICAPTPSCDPLSWSSNFTMYNMSFHDNYVHDTEHESFYLGNTSNSYTVSCNGVNSVVEPVKIAGLKVYNNVVERSGWDGIQISSAISGVEIHDNKISNYGVLNIGSQNAGLILGNVSSGKIYNNIINSGTGAGFQDFGCGMSQVYNNIFVNNGYDGSSVGQDAVVIDDRPNLGGYKPLSVQFVNNTIVNPRRYGILMYNDYHTVGTGNVIANNLIAHPGYVDIWVDKGIDVSLSNNLTKATVAEVQFVDVNSNWRLNSTSPAIDAGKDASGYGVTTDFDSKPRPTGKAFDIGAIEYQQATTSAPTNQPPVVSAGSAQTLTLPYNWSVLSGSASDPDGSIASYAWTKVQGPAQFNILNPSNPATNFNNVVAGTYVFQLTVTDNKGATASSTVTVTVNGASAANQAPVANAGGDQSITLPSNSVTLNGNSSSDPDGSISSYSWTKTQGPTQFTIANGSNVSTAVSNLAAGTYVFQLTVTDNKGATATDNVTITVNSAAASPANNQAPVAKAGWDQTIKLPVNSVTVNGNGSYDPDGSIVGYSWSMIKGSKGSIANPSSMATQVTGLAAGVYSFQLVVTDNHGATAKSVVTVWVNAASAAAELTAGSLQGTSSNTDVNSAVKATTKGAQTLTMYPNPADANLHVRFYNEKLEKVKVVISDLQGQLVKSAEFVKEQFLLDRAINVSDLRTGSYNVTIIRPDGERITSKMIKR